MIKKLIFIVIISLMLTGCYDYQELNDRAIIVGIAIDYIDNEFVVNFEVLNSKKSSSEQSGSNKSYLIEGKDPTFSMAYQKALFSLNKDAYLAHIKAVIFSEEIAKNHFENILDYIIRDPNTRNVFYPVVVSGYQAKDIVFQTSEQTPIVSEAIENLIDYNNYKESITTKMNFEKTLELFLSDNEDAYMNVITLDNQNQIKANGLAIFQGYNMVNILDDKEAATSLLLNNKSMNYYISLPCENDTSKHLTLNLYDNYHTNLEVSNTTITINSKINADIMDDECNYNFKNPQLYQTIEQKFSEKLASILTKEVYNYMSFNSDILGIQRIYYIQNRQKLKNWQQLNVQTNIKLIINKNGIIYGVN